MKTAHLKSHLENDPQVSKVNGEPGKQAPRKEKNDTRDEQGKALSQVFREAGRAN